MRKRILRMPSPAMTVALIALFVALSGGAYAAVTLPRNSVGTAQIKPDAVIGSKVKNRSLRGPDLALDAVGTANIAPGAVGTADLAAGVITPDKLATVPAASAYGTFQGPPGSGTSHVIANGVYTPLNLLLESFDNAAIHHNQPNYDMDVPERFIAPIAGVYHVDAGVYWGGNTTGTRFLGIAVNGVPWCKFCYSAADERPAAAELTQSVSALIQLNAGDYVVAVVEQGSGGDVTLDKFDGRTHLSMYWVGP